MGSTYLVLLLQGILTDGGGKGLCSILNLNLGLCSVTQFII